jgi:hypothetical protein
MTSPEISPVVPSKRGDNLFARVMLAWAAAGHVLTGLCLFFSGEGGLRVAAAMYGASFDAHPQAVYLVRPLGAFMLALGYLQARAAVDPWRLRAVLDATILVFGLRQIQRLAWAPAVFELFGLTPARHWAGTGFFLATLVLLIVARVRLKPPRSET